MNTENTTPDEADLLIRELRTVKIRLTEKRVKLFNSKVRRSGKKVQKASANAKKRKVIAAVDL